MDICAEICRQEHYQSLLTGTYYTSLINVKSTHFFQLKKLAFLNFYKFFEQRKSNQWELQKRKMDPQSNLFYTVTESEWLREIVAWHIYKLVITEFFVSLAFHTPLTIGYRENETAFTLAPFLLLEYQRWILLQDGDVMTYIAFFSLFFPLPVSLI